MSEEPDSADQPLEEELVAYLDGELDAEASRGIEDRLAADPEVRQTLHRLDRTWEMLDELDPPQVAERFTQTTLEIVAESAEEEVRRSRAEAPRRRRRRWAVATAGLLAAGLAGFLGVALFAPDLNRQLIQDLEMLQRLDQYRQINDVEFLRMLHRERLFVEEADDGQ